MAMYLELEKVLDDRHIITVHTKAYGSIDVVPVDTITDIPLADAQPVVHAYWIRGKEFGFKTHNPMWYCSNCGGGIRYNTTLRTYEKHKKPVEEVNCFCRKCGAKMDREPIYEREENNNG